MLMPRVPMLAESCRSRRFVPAFNDPVRVAVPEPLAVRFWPLASTSRPLVKPLMFGLSDVVTEIGIRGRVALLLDLAKELDVPAVTGGIVETELQGDILPRLCGVIEILRELIVDLFCRQALEAGVQEGSEGCGQTQEILSEVALLDELVDGEVMSHIPAQELARTATGKGIQGQMKSLMQ